MLPDVGTIRKRQQVLADFGEFALQSEDLDAILTEACRLVAEALGTARAKVLEILDDGQTLFLRAGVGWPREIIGQLRLRMEDYTSESYSIRQAVPVVTQNIAEESRFDIPEFMKRERVVALVNVPILLLGKTIYGLLQVDSTEPRDFGQDEIQFLRTYAMVLGPVIDRVLKVQELRAGEERFRLTVESARDYAIFHADAEDRITEWFPGAQAVFGWTAEEIVGQSGAVLFTAEDRKNREPEKEIETARREGRAPDVRWHLHKGGRRIFIEGSVTALRQSDGRLRGFLKIGQDITERRKAEEKLRESEARQRALIEGVPLLVWRATPEGAWTWSSPQWTEFTGLSEEASRGHGWLDALHADDREPARAAWQSAGKSRALSMETRVFHRGENRYRWFATRAAAVIDDTTGRVIEWLGTSTDIDDLRRLQETQAVMVAELQHRTRNLLAVVRAVAQQTLANSDSLDSFRTQFNDRMAALGRVQGLLSRSDQEPITIGALIRLELDAVGALASDRISASGPEVRIRKAAVQTLALAIHELATNARKYGALASDEGRLAIAWRTTRRDHERRLVIDWVEESIAIDLAAVEKSSGYGRELIGRALPYTLGAVTRYELGATGLRCSIDLPLSEAAQRKEQP